MQPPRGLVFITQEIYKHGVPCEMLPTGENYLFVHQSSLAVLPAASSSSIQEEIVKEIMNFAL
jgi:hypothetical protein